MRFSDCLGHDLAISIINGYIEKNRFSGGYIFSGPEGIGKKMVAKIIAQKLNCTADSDKPCGSCSSCLRIQKMQHPDVHIIENDESQIKIEDIRNIQREASFRPYEGVMKFFIIDNAHKINSEAANALLKILEEPPKDSVIILLTHKVQTIFPTVLSRCKQIRFAPLPRASLESILVKDYFLSRDTAHFLSYYCEGRLGFALKLKDSKIVQEKNGIFNSFMLSEKPLDGNYFSQSKDQLRVCLNILASWIRDVYLLKAGIKASEIIHTDRHSDLLALAHRFSFKQLDNIILQVSDSSMYLDNNINTKLLLHNLGAQLWMA
ncbi:MAG: DNA polymerase III subunit delta' [Candidatus Omnitrophica bacterium]|nr:DNA polymerase III subunit delta' [Candidatus Omnitrophota bacterium]MDO9573240.1 DNA polymerase III subunit delta' [Candidatus Omnitrophota bacterium]